MADIWYVLPDTLGGDPAGREALARSTGCDIVEVGPANLPPPTLPWLLRVVARDEDGRDRPRWRDRAWTAALVTRATAGDRAPTAVVVEPGDEFCTPADLVRGITAIRDGCADRYGAAPAVLVANRAEGALPDGGALAEFWDYLLRHAPDLSPHAGVALDVPELYAVTRTRMAAELALVPPGALRYLRVHTHGRKPDLGEALPWGAVFGLVREAPGTVWIAPAVTDPAALEPAILFCMISLQGRRFT